MQQDKQTQNNTYDNISRTSIFYASNNKLNPRRINNEWIKSNYPEFNNIPCFTSDIREKIYSIENNIKEKPKCICGRDLLFNKTKYKKFCSKECSYKNKEYPNKYLFTTEEFKIKSKKTFLEKYGVEHPMKNEEVKKKVQDNTDYETAKIVREKSNMLKYGVKNTFGLITNSWNKNNTSCDFSGIDTGNLTLKEISEKIESSYSNTSLQLIKQGLSYKKINSFTEKEIGSMIPNSIINTRKIISPLELDVYSEDYNFAIEYNGLIWHSYGKSKHTTFNNYEEENPNYHLNKTELCEEKGIQLYHIFENEWLDDNKKEIWISMIRDKQGLNKKIGARKCIIKEVSTKDAKEFIDNNHIQGYINAKIKIGLYYRNTLMSIMTFSKPRFNDKVEYELIRFCTKQGYTVQGGGSKLLKYFEKTYKPKSLISYANRRWSNGNFYFRSGFDFVNCTKPNYFYFKINENILYSRNKFQKHKLKNLLENFNSAMTEKENMYNNEYRRIYDCGSKVFIKEY